VNVDGKPTVRRSTLTAKPDSELDLGAVWNTHFAQGLVVEFGERSNNSPGLALILPVVP
jgi:hypothetical protein